MEARLKFESVELGEVRFRGLTQRLKLGGSRWFERLKLEDKGCTEKLMLETEVVAGVGD